MSHSFNPFGARALIETAFRRLAITNLPAGCFNPFGARALIETTLWKIC